MIDGWTGLKFTLRERKLVGEAIANLLESPVESVSIKVETEKEGATNDRENMVAGSTIAVGMAQTNLGNRISMVGPF